MIARFETHEEVGISISMGRLTVVSPFYEVGVEGNVTGIGTRIDVGGSQLNLFRVFWACSKSMVFTPLYFSWNFITYSKEELYKCGSQMIGIYFSISFISFARDSKLAPGRRIQPQTSARSLRTCKGNREETKFSYLNKAGSVGRRLTSIADISPCKGFIVPGNMSITTLTMVITNEHR